MIPVIKKYFLFISFFLTLFLNGQNFDAVVAEMAVEYEADIIELRHWFHQNAELSKREFKTAEKISDALSKICLKDDNGIAKTVVVTVLNGGKTGQAGSSREDK